MRSKTLRDINAPKYPSINYCGVIHTNLQTAGEKHGTFRSAAHQNN